MTALGLGTHLGVPRPTEPWKRALYRLDQLDQLGVATPGLLVPSSSSAYEGYQQQLLDHYIEIQLWIDEPVTRFLSR
jgi:hypothetical protein